jgi:hypothetical protein
MFSLLFYVFIPSFSILFSIADGPLLGASYTTSDGWPSIKHSRVKSLKRIIAVPAPNADP